VSRSSTRRRGRCWTRWPDAAGSAEYLVPGLLEAVHRAGAASIMFRVPGPTTTAPCTSTAATASSSPARFGPYKGGLRFHPSGEPRRHPLPAFEQVSRTPSRVWPSAGGKGGSDFDPKAAATWRSCACCQSFMDRGSTATWVVRPTVPPATIGVAAARSGFLFGSTSASPTASRPACSPARASAWGGAQVRTEATGYGLVLFVERCCARGAARSTVSCVGLGARATSPSTRPRRPSSSGPP